MAGATEMSKPKRIKALLSSFLKGTSKEEQTESEKETSKEEVGLKTGSKDRVTGGGDQEGFVVIDEWSPSKGEQAGTVQPQNRDGFFRRVETFSTSKWFAKPEGVSPLHCARYGWENIHTDSLKCVSCKEVVYGGLPPKWELEAYQKESKRLQEALKDGHSKVCPWPSNPCPASFMEVQLVNCSQSREAFLHRVASVRCLSSKVPALDRSAMLQVDIDEAELNDSISRLVTGVLGEEPTSDYKERIEVVCSIALCGWSRSSPEDSSIPTISCEYCRRNVGLLNFSFLEERQGREQSTEESSEPATKKFKVDKGPFDPLGEHRTWCPWIKSAAATYRAGPLSPRAAEGKGAGADGAGDEPSRPAWQQLLTLLLMSADPESQNSDGVLTNKETTPTSEAWKVVRRITNFWQSRGASRKT